VSIPVEAGDDRLRFGHIAGRSEAPSRTSGEFVRSLTVGKSLRHIRWSGNSGDGSHTQPSTVTMEGLRYLRASECLLKIRFTVRRNIFDNEIDLRRLLFLMGEPG